MQNSAFKSFPCVSELQKLIKNYLSIPNSTVAIWQKCLLAQGPGEQQLNQAASAVFTEGTR